LSDGGWAIADLRSDNFGGAKSCQTVVGLEPIYVLTTLGGGRVRG